MKIKRLNKFTKEHKKVFGILEKKIFDKPKPEKEFNSFGLRFSDEHLKKMGGAIILMPLEYMAEYVDIVTKARIDEHDEDFITQQILGISPTADIDNIAMEKWNATSIGNIAYIALNCKDEDAQKISIQLLENYYDYYFKINGMTDVGKW